MILLLDDGGVMSVSDLVELHMSPVSLIARLSELEHRCPQGCTSETYSTRYHYSRNS